jgi:hypothetical protein
MIVLALDPTIKDTYFKAHWEPECLKKATLVGRFKYFSTIYSEKCCLFFRDFSPKKELKNSKHFLSSR